ncbi:MAG: hypothetical protein VR72_09465 [Clostridiaceae bacterium BRH_c20a]|nr:MAG: hypothetical protein VR72_09465 [Clostridiaceae bacterium BRH_c20a]
MSGQTVGQKMQIYFSRSYRHLKPDSKERLFLLLGCVLPCVVFFLFFYTKISYLLAVWVKEALTVTIPESSLRIAYAEFLPFFGGVYYVQIPSTMPSFQEITLNLAVTLILLFICFLPSRNSKGGTPLFIYFAIILLTHLIAIIFFMFAQDFYPYSATHYSELYIKQQVGIWLSFLVLSGLIMGILGYGGITGRLIAFWGTMTYSFVFGCVRYLASMFIISKVSSLYMAILFFSLGPLFDFLYLVCFYSIYINAQINRFDQGERRLKWLWL